MESYKQEKIIIIMYEYLNDKREFYPISNVPLDKAKFFYKDDDGLFKLMAVSDYTVKTELNENRLYIVNAAIKDNSEKFQIGYEINFKAAEYESPLPVLSVLTKMYNQLIEDTRILHSYIRKQCFVADGKEQALVLPGLPAHTVWCMGENGKMFALPVSELYERFQGLINKLYDEIKKLTSIYTDTLKNELKKNAEQIINNIAEQKTSMKLQPNITRYQLPSTWIITDKTEVYINGLLISKEMYRIENYELILNDSLSDEADLVIKISLPSTYIEELKNTAKEDIDNYITEKKKELKGDKGTIFKPNVDNLGNLTWSNDDGLPNPPSTNIMGPQGKPGVPGRDGEQGPPGKNGEDGKDLTNELQGTIGMKFDENLTYLNDTGTKKVGFCYLDKLTPGIFECIKETTTTVNDIEYFKNFSNKENSDKINSLKGYEKRTVLLGLAKEEKEIFNFSELGNKIVPLEIIIFIHNRDLGWGSGVLNAKYITYSNLLGMKEIYVQAYHSTQKSQIRFDTSQKKIYAIPFNNNMAVDILLLKTI